jgi:DNA repair protein RadC
LGRRRRDSDDIEISLASPQQLFDYIMPLLADNPIEEFWVILANRKLSLIRSQMMFRGGIDAVSVDIRLIMKYALEHNASCIAIAHNHPSGQAKPSTHDKEITSRLKEACNFMSIQLLDHIIVASNKSYFSFADSGLIDW